MFPRKPVREIAYEEISDEILRDDLKGMANKLRTTVVENEIRLKMPIAEFERNWLAMFIGKSSEPSKGIPVARWYSEVTNNPYTWVDIVLPNGEVAYSVPPLLNSNAVKINHVDFYHHLMELEAMADHGASKMELDRYREKHILQFIGRDETADTYMDEINKMAMFHGYAPFTKTESVSKSGKVLDDQGSTGFGEMVRVDEF